MMFPASTCSPPKRFTPRRLECESRPFLVLPPAFLCAMSRSVCRKDTALSACADVRDLHFREQLAMVLLPQVMGAALELHHRHFGALAMTHHGGEHLAAFQGRRADPDVAPHPH